MNASEIVEVILDLRTASARAEFLRRACVGDPGLRASVEELLSAQSGPSLSETDGPTLVKESSLDDGTALETRASDSDLDSVPDESGEIGGLDRFEFLQPAIRPGTLGMLSHYQILERLGRGAFGIVFKAFDEKLQRLVAIKVLDPQLANTAAPRKRFLREARAAAGIRHVNVIRVYDVEESPLPYLVMEFIDGETLQEKIDRAGPLETLEVVQIGRQIASGLAAAGDLKLIHRDIKPGNILLEKGEGGRVRITDFGLARSVDDASLTRSGLLAGTPLFMSPEQANGDPIDHRSDLFSLGSVLYTMAAGRPPFRAHSTMAVLRRVIEDRARPLREVLSDIPDWLEKIVETLHCKNPAQRYQSAREVSELLGRCLVGIQSQDAGVETGHAVASGPPAGVSAWPAENRHGLTKSSSRQGLVDDTPGSESDRLDNLGDPPYRFWSRVGSNRQVTYSLGLLLLVSAAAIWFVWSQQAGSRTGPSKQGAIGSVPASGSASEPSLGHQPSNRPWHGWPAAAPAPAVAPFDADQARIHQQEWANYLSLPVEYRDSLGMEFVLIPPGEFVMGSSAEECTTLLNLFLEPPEQVNTERYEGVQSQAPAHRVVLTEPFYLGRHEVTQSQFSQVMIDNPSELTERWRPGLIRELGLQPERHPVDQVVWFEAKQFCDRLNSQRQFPADQGYRLPTEAEWEFGCRAGSTQMFCNGDDAIALAAVGWFRSNSNHHSHPPATRLPNAFGLFDMHGNMWEWVEDEWQIDSYEQYRDRVSVNPGSHPADASRRVLRGGAIGEEWWLCGSATRFSYFPSSRFNIFGFRVALAVEAVRGSLGRTGPALPHVTPPSDQ